MLLRRLAANPLIALLAFSTLLNSGQSLAQASEIPVRVYHSPAGELGNGSFNFESGPGADATDPTELIQSAVVPIRGSVELDIWFWNGDVATVPGDCVGGETPGDGEHRGVWAPLATRGKPNPRGRDGHR